jgi:hypothetical protein
LASLIKDTWVTIDVTKKGYARVLNIWTDVVLGPDSPGYDGKIFQQLLDELKPHLEHYDRANIESAVR